MSSTLKDQIERRIAGWLNANGIDTHLNKADWKMAQEIMARKEPWQMNQVLYFLPNINDLLDGKTVMDRKTADKLGLKCDDKTIAELAKY